MCGWDVVLAVVRWSLIANIERQGTLFRIVCRAVFLGGAGRVVAWLSTGSPEIAFAIVTGIELLVPLLIPWQSRVARHAGS